MAVISTLGQHSQPIIGNLYASSHLLHGIQSVPFEVDHCLSWVLMSQFSLKSFIFDTHCQVRDVHIRQIVLQHYTLIVFRKESCLHILMFLFAKNIFVVFALLSLVWPNLKVHWTLGAVIGEGNSDIIGKKIFGEYVLGYMIAILSFH